MGKESTKVALLEAGRRTFLEKGYNASGIEAILQAAGVPKGSFYYYFSSKEDFGLQVLDHFARISDELMDRSLGDTSLGPLERLRRHFETAVSCLEAQGCRCGCLAGKFSQEMADQSEVFRVRLEELFERWVGRVAEGLRAAQAAGEVPADLDVGELAEFWLNSWQGAIMRSKSMRSVAPLRTFLGLMFGHVLQPA